MGKKINVKKSMQQKTTIDEKYIKYDRKHVGDKKSLSHKFDSQRIYDNDMENLIEYYKKKSLDLVISKIIVVDKPFPYPPRGNFTLTHFINTGELIMFGGEYSNGVKNIVLDELLRWDPGDKTKSFSNTQGKYDPTVPHRGLWKLVISPPPTPAPRCSHIAIFYNHAIYIHGGESASADRFYHYRDFWKFDLDTNIWTEMKPLGGKKYSPSARSGHRAIVWKHYLFIFGGFYDTMCDVPRWFNDLYCFDFKANKWIEIIFSNLAEIPPERSACNFVLCHESNVAYMYGGYSKLRNPRSEIKVESCIHGDCWALHFESFNEVISMLHQEKEVRNILKWEYVPKKGNYPSLRSGMACVSFDNKMLLYGGVEDKEVCNDQVKSTFFDDIFLFDMSKRRWFSMNFKNGSNRDRKDTVCYIQKKKSRINKKSCNNVEGTNKDRVEIDYYKSIHDSDLKEKYMRINDVYQTTVCKLPIPSVIPKFLNNRGNLEQRECSQRNIPLPRIKAQTCIRKNTLYVYGGIVEVGNREVTLDDCWSIDLEEQGAWTCIWQGSMNKLVWDDSDREIEKEATDYNQSGSESDKHVVQYNDILYKDVKKNPRQKICANTRTHFNKFLNIDNNPLPKKDELLAEYYFRTSFHWEKKSADILNDAPTIDKVEMSIKGKLFHKIQKKNGFHLAWKFYNGFKPSVDNDNESNSELNKK